MQLLRAGHEHEAATCLREAVCLSPDDARARYHLALAHRLRGELTEARAELLAALELEPTLAPACAQLGGLALVAGELQEAMSWLSRALAPPWALEIKRTASRLSRSLDTVLVPGEADAVLPELIQALRRMR